MEKKQSKQSLYSILEVAKAATQDQIKTSYKKLALGSDYFDNMFLEVAPGQAQGGRPRKSDRVVQDYQ